MTGRRRAFAGAVLAALLGCGTASDSPRPPNVLLVTIDTLRADRVSAYGHARETTPVLDGLAARGVRFENAYASSSWTAPSVASLLTSLQPASHGVEHGHVVTGDKVTADGVAEQEGLADALALWPELLGPAGYTRFAVTANAHLDARFGFARGFDRYRCVGFTDLSAVEAVLDEWEPELLAAAPWFLWVHLFDPHAPYEAWADWIRRERPDFRALPAPLAGVKMAAQYQAMGVRRGTPAFDLVNLAYDSEVARSDAAIGRLLERLDVGPHDLVLVTSDHGESFLEHGRFGHGYNLHEEVVRVPLVLHLPGGPAGRVVDAPVRGIDLLPTVLDALDLPAPSTLQGRSLLPLLRGDEAAPRDVVLDLQRFPSVSARAIRRGPWKYIAPRRGEPALYDLGSDPAEQRNLAAERPDVARDLDGALGRHAEVEAAARVEPRLEPLRPDELEQLRALGYTDD